jgi:superfamily II DNA or RNA helicase
MTSKEKNQTQKEILDSLPSKLHGRLLLAPRCGKTKIAIDIIKKVKPKTILWITPSAKLAEEDIPQEFVKWKAKAYLKKLTTVTWASLNKIEGHYDIIIGDEEQFATENNLETMLNGKLKSNQTIFMTGTQTKHENKKDLYRKLKLPLLYRLSINEAVNIGILSNYEIKVLNVNLSNEKNLKVGNKNNTFLTSELANYNYLSQSIAIAIENNENKFLKFKILNRMRLIHNSTSKFKAAKILISQLKGKKLIFTANIKQAEDICKNTYHSKTTNEDLKKFQSGEIDTIAMVNSGGIGFTYKNIDHLILIQADSDKNGMTSQKISRVLLEQINYKATIWIICLKNTQDEKWVASTLENFNKEKIKYINEKI